MGWIGLCGMLIVGCNSSGGTSGTGGNSGTGGSGGSAVAINCVAACAVISSCTQETPASCLARCQGQLMEAADFSARCGAAVNDLAGCVGGLSCEQLEAWSDKVPPDGYPCRAEEIAIDNCLVIDT